jgi:hypothetical protein
MTAPVAVPPLTEPERVDPVVTSPKRKRMRFPLSAVLEVIAVLLVLVFILLRLS